MASSVFSSTSRFSRGATRQRTLSLRITGAALLSVTALFGTATGTVADSTIACAAPKRPGGFDRELFDQCYTAASDRAIGAIESGSVSGDWIQRRFYEDLRECCEGSGGEWFEIAGGEFGEGDCVDPDDFGAPAPGEIPQFPGEVPATLGPPPPPPPTGPFTSPPGNPTVAPPATVPTLTPIPGSPPAQTG